MSSFGYLGRLRDASEQRRHTPYSISIGYVIFAAVLTIGFLAFAVLVAPNETRNIEFLEGGIVTWMSAAFMACTSAMALICSLVCRQGFLEGKLFWFLFGTGFIFFSLDELMQFHERFGNVVAMSSIGPPKGFRNWNDILVIGYGVIGLTGLIVFLPEFLRYRGVAELLAIGFGFYVVHTTIDSLVTVPNNWSIILEESAKLFSVFFIASATLFALSAMVKQSWEPLAGKR